MRICKSRKNMFSVMKGGGEIQPLLITRDGISVLVSPDGMMKDGRLKKYELERINKIFKRHKKEIEHVIKAC